MEVAAEQREGVAEDLIVFLIDGNVLRDRLRDPVLIADNGIRRDIPDIFVYQANIIDKITKFYFNYYIILHICTFKYDWLVKECCLFMKKTL